MPGQEDSSGVNVSDVAAVAWAGLKSPALRYCSHAGQKDSR
jgi:hypothetical protein